MLKFLKRDLDEKASGTIGAIDLSRRASQVLKVTEELLEILFLI